MNGTTPTTQDTPDKGRLQINLVSDISAYPIQGAQIGRDVRYEINLTSLPIRSRGLRFPSSTRVFQKLS